MPRAWSRKDERKYEKIRRSARRRGASPERAKEIAARTVNRDRREEGRARSPTPRGTGNPNLPLEERSKRQLYHRARELGVEGRSRMSKRELVRAIRKAS